MRPVGLNSHYEMVDSILVNAEPDPLKIDLRRCFWVGCCQFEAVVSHRKLVVPCFVEKDGRIVLLSFVDLLRRY